MSTKFRFLPKRHSSGAVFRMSPTGDGSVRPLYAVFALVECCILFMEVAWSRFADVCSLLSPGFTYYSLSIWASAKNCLSLSMTSGLVFARSFLHARSSVRSYSCIGLEG